MEVATREEIADAIDIPSPVGTALCMAAAVKKDHEIGNVKTFDCLAYKRMSIFKLNLSEVLLKKSNVLFSSLY